MLFASSTLFSIAKRKRISSSIEWLMIATTKLVLLIGYFSSEDRRKIRSILNLPSKNAPIARPL